jgi:8-oxo-dGTP diphosphatase
MIKLLNGTAAFLKRDNQYLLMERSADREIAPGVWSGIGGKIEAHELNDPQTACMREIGEESGISAENIHGLTLRYIIMRRHRDTIRQTYVYFGETNAEPTISTNEGNLHWILESELLDRRYTATFQAMMNHYIQRPDTERVTVGVAENENGICRMVWSGIEDFEPEISL